MARNRLSRPPIREIVAGGLCALCATLASGLVLYDLGARSLWVDEATTWGVARQHGAALWQAVLQDGGNMSGFYMATHFVVELFGSSPLVLRFAPALAFVATVPCCYLLVRRLFERLEAQAGPEPGAIIERAAEQLVAAFPAIASVRRAGFLGRGPVEEVALDVPRRDDLLRYALARTRQGGVEATVTRFLRGIKNKTLAVDVDDWTRGLIEDLGAYAERERGARDTLTRLFRERR